MANREPSITTKNRPVLTFFSPNPSIHRFRQRRQRAASSSADLVAKVRPDTYWYQAVMPWCSFVNTETVHLNGYWGDFLDKTGGSSAIVSYPPDQFFLLPRQLAPMIFEGLLDSYQDCPTGSIEAGYSIEEWGEIIIIMQNRSHTN